MAQVLTFLGGEKYRDTLNRPGYAPLVKDFNIFFERWMYRRIGDLFARPIDDIPGGYTSVMLRSGIEKSLIEPLKVTGESKRCLNLGSYNYLGFAENKGMPVDATEQSIRDWGITPSTSRMELGTTLVHKELERYVKCLFINHVPGRTMISGIFQSSLERKTPSYLVWATQPTAPLFLLSADMEILLLVTC